MSNHSLHPGETAPLLLLWWGGSAVDLLPHSSWRHAVHHGETPRVGRAEIRLQQGRDFTFVFCLTTEHHGNSEMDRCIFLCIADHDINHSSQPWKQFLEKWSKSTYWLNSDCYLMDWIICQMCCFFCCCFFSKGGIWVSPKIDRCENNLACWPYCLASSSLVLTSRCRLTHNFFFHPAEFRSRKQVLTLEWKHFNKTAKNQKQFKCFTLKNFILLHKSLDFVLLTM